MSRLLRQTLCLLLIAALLVAPLEPAFASAVGDAVKAFDIDTLRYPLKVFDIVPSEWSSLKKAELSAALDVAQAIQDKENIPWYNVFGKIGAISKINQARKDFMFATKRRVQFENELNARPINFDAGFLAYKGLLKVADFAGSLDGTGPIFSQLNGHYNSLVTLLIQHENTSILNQFKRISIDNEIRKEGVEVYRLSKNLKNSKILQLATTLMKGGSKDGNSGGTLGNIIKIGTVVGGVIAIIGGIVKMTQSKSASAAPQRINAAPSLAPAAAPVATFAASPVAGDSADRLRTLMERYRVEAAKESPDPATLQELQVEMNAARGR